jgi:hypothetical protein
MNCFQHLLFQDSAFLWKTSKGVWEYFVPFVAVTLGDTVEAQKVIPFVIPLHHFFFRKRLFFSLLSLLEFNRTIAEIANGKKEDTNLIQSLCFRVKNTSLASSTIPFDYLVTIFPKMVEVVLFI